MRTEHVEEVDIEAVVGLREDEVGLKEDVVDPGGEARMGTVIRQQNNQV